MKKVFFTIIVLIFFIFSCKERIAQTAKVPEQKIEVVDSDKKMTKDSTIIPQFFIDNIIVAEKEKELVKLNPIDPFKGKSVEDSMFIYVKRLGKRGRIGRTNNTLTRYTSQNGKAGLAFNNINFDLSMFDRKGNFLGKRSMKEYDLDGEGSSKYIIREDGKGVLIYDNSGSKKNIDIYTPNDGILLLERQIKLPKSDFSWRILSTAKGKMLIYNSNKKENNAIIIVYDLSTGQEIQRQKFKDTHLGTLVVSPEEHFVVSTHRRSSTVRVFNNQLKLLKQFDGVQKGGTPSFYEKNGIMKMAYFTWDKIYLYDLPKKETNKIEIIKEGSFMSDLTFLNDSTLIYGIFVTNTAPVYSNNTKITESYLYTQGIGAEKYVSLVGKGLGSISFSEEEGRQYLYSKFRNKAGKVYEF